MTSPSFDAVTLASSIWNRSASYGRYAQELMRVLTSHHIHVNTVGSGFPNPNFKLTGINLVIGYPTQHQRFGQLVNSGVKIALSMWESTVCPKGWRDALNACDAVVVPCQWNAEVFRDNSVTAPISVLPLGLSDAFQYQKRRDDKVFRFLLIADRDQRKGWNEGMDAFLLAFGKRSDVELVVKLRQSLPKWHPLLNLSNPNIRVIDADYSDEQMAALYASCDSLIFGASGEAWGWPPREFAATGGIALATNYGGLTEDIRQWGVPIDYRLVPAWSLHPQHAGLGEWGQVDVEHLASAMKVVREMPFGLRRDLGKTFSRNARSLYSWDDYGNRLLDVIEQAVGRHNAKRRSA